MANLKNIFRIIFLSFVVLTAASCQEYRVLDKELEYEAATDNYRAYYEIFVGAFSDSNKDGIGDLKGVLRRLDYLNDGKPNSGKSLGIEGIWLMPIMPSPSYHKYDVADYYGVDPSYGTMADFENLAAECNKRGVKLIIDLVINHTSERHPWFAAAKQAIKEGNLDAQYAKYYVLDTKESAGKVWHKLEKAPDGTQYYYEGNFSNTMPELNMDNPDVRREIAGIAKFWLDKGAGGFRLDAVKFIYIGEDNLNIQFLKWFDDECKKTKRDAYIVAENWSDAASIQKYYEAVNCFDFGMSGTTGDVYFTVQEIRNVTEYAERLALYQKQVLVKNAQAILNHFITNHDMDRAAGFLDVGNYKMQVAANLYLLSSGSPFIYYGEEIGMKGARGIEQTDANRRLAMLWGGGDTVKDPEGGDFDRTKQTNGTVKSQLPKKTSLLNHYKKLIRLRKANPEIARGLVKPLDFSQYEAFGGFISEYNGSRIAVFHNTGEKEITADLKDNADVDFSTVRGYAGKGKAVLNGTLLTLSGHTSAVLK
jgi:glycosidase